MERRLTGKERALLLQLSELMSEYDCIISTADGRICIEVEDADATEAHTIPLPGVTTPTDIDELVNKNS